MNSQRVFITVLLGAIGLAALSGCSGSKKLTSPKANERPIIELTRAPYNESTRFEYSYRMNWLGYDPDGRVAYYLYAIDPPSPTAQNPEPETTWVQTDKSERLINFSATQLDSSRVNVDGASDFHTPRSPAPGSNPPTAWPGRTPEQRNARAPARSYRGGSSPR